MVRHMGQKPEGIYVMERTFQTIWIQDTGLIAATLLNECVLKSTEEYCPERRLLVQVEVPHWKSVNTSSAFLGTNLQGRG
jgi:hypothetical protein